MVTGAGRDRPTFLGNLETAGRHTETCGQTHIHTDRQTDRHKHTNRHTRTDTQTDTVRNCTALISPGRDSIGQHSKYYSRHFSDNYRHSTPINRSENQPFLCVRSLVGTELASCSAHRWSMTSSVSSAGQVSLQGSNSSFPQRSFRLGYVHKTFSLL